MLNFCGTMVKYNLNIISVIGLLVIVSDCVTSNDLLIKFHKGGIRDFNERVY